MLTHAKQVLSLISCFWYFSLVEIFKDTEGNKRVKYLNILDGIRSGATPRRNVVLIFFGKKTVVND